MMLLPFHCLIRIVTLLVHYGLFLISESLHPLNNVKICLFAFIMMTYGDLEYLGIN
jgi:hypothetical protein